MTQPRCQEPASRPLPTATFKAELPDFSEPAANQPATDTTGGGGGGPPYDDEPVLMHDDLRVLAWDVLLARNALCTLEHLLRDADGMDSGPVRGLVVLLEGPRARLDLAVDALANIARDCQVEGVPR